MKTLRMFGALLLTCVMCLNFVACDDDPTGNSQPDAPGVVNPSNVFAEKAPQSAVGLDITRNDKGLVTKMVSSDGSEITFNYNNAITRATSNYIVMTVKHPHYPDEIVFNLVIGTNGFISNWKNVTHNENGMFGYNGDGQLNYLKYNHADGGYDELKMTYENGNLTETNSRDTYYFTTGYTNADGTTIPNKGGVMVYDDQTFGIEGDDYCDLMNWLHYAGLLGKATKDLPLSFVDYFDDEGKYEWQLDDSGFPVKFMNPEASEVDEVECSFSW